MGSLLIVPPLPSWLGFRFLNTLCPAQVLGVWTQNPGFCGCRSVEVSVLDLGAYPFGGWGLVMVLQALNVSAGSVPGDPVTCKQITNADTVRNMEWATATCVLGFGVFGKLYREGRPAEDRNQKSFWTTRLVVHPCNPSIQQAEAGGLP